jgi:two-component system, OmpR family, sensor histidine kinase KdpD
MDTNMDTEDAAPSRPWPVNEWWIVIALLAAATAIGLVVDPYVTLASQAMVYVLAVVVASYTLPLIPSAVCAVGGVVLLNFFFVPPRFTFQVASREHLFTLFTMLAVALVISHLGTALRSETEAARRNERRARQLQELATEVAAAEQPVEVQVALQQQLAHAFAGPCVTAVLLPDGELNLPGEHRLLRDGMRACMREAATLGPGTGRWPGLDAWYVPLGVAGHLTGAACVQNVSAYDHAGREHAQALCALAGQALWRLKLAASMRTAQEESQWHRVQSTFLAAVSHDLRTPLAALMGAASALQTQRDKLPAAEQDRLLASIVGEARYLSTVAENTLQLVRLGSGGNIERDWQSMEEIVGAVLARVRQRDPGRRIKSHVPPQLPLIQADPVLLTQLLDNLLDNALKYSGDAVDLTVTPAGGELHVCVEDRGPGVAPGSEQAIFEPYRRSDRSGQRGAGLGLAVCRAIAHAHGGSLALRPREGGGASFVISLPVSVQQPVSETT